MLSLSLGRGSRAPLTVLCLGAHADDIEIGCGGTILRLLEDRPRVTVHWVVLTADSNRAREARRSASRVLRRARAQHVRIERFRDGFLPYEGAAVKEVFEQVKTAVNPDLIFTHFRDDWHQDHRLVCELTWNTFRDHTILEYEIPKYDGDLAHPNVFVPLSDRVRRQKVRLLMSAFPSQARKRWYTPATFDGLMRLRGVECGASEGYAEAFHGRKVILRPTMAGT
jgi:LmbE family N-acetylglucosaminyl deacetylase